MKRRYMIPLLILVVLGIAYWAGPLYKQKTSYEISLGLVGSDMFIRDRSTGWNRPYQ